MADSTPDSIGIIIVDHGSRRAESNDLLLDVVKLFERLSAWPIVEPAHMELASPTIAEAFDRCVERGANLVVVHPYFLLPGKHWKQDIPALTAEAAARHSAVQYVVTAPLGLHNLMVSIMNERITHCLACARGDAPSCEVCGDGEGCRFRHAMADAAP